MLALLLIAESAHAQSTGFTYQGRLTDAGNPAGGLYGMQFKLFDTAAVGTGIQHGSALTDAKCDCPLGRHCNQQIAG